MDISENCLVKEQITAYDCNIITSAEKRIHCSGIPELLIQCVLSIACSQMRCMNSNSPWLAAKSSTTSSRFRNSCGEGFSKVGAIHD